VGYSARKLPGDIVAEHAGGPGRSPVRLPDREPAGTPKAFAGWVGLGCGRPVIVGVHEPLPAIPPGAPRAREGACVDF